MGPVSETHESRTGQRAHPELISFVSIMSARSYFVPQ